MNVEEIREYCLAKPFTSEGLPFGESTLVIKVMDKMFILIPLDAPELKINLKANAEYSIELREQFPAIIPGYHMNKKLWNTISVEELNDGLFLKTLIDHSYEEVMKKLPKYKQDIIKQNN